MKSLNAMYQETKDKEPNLELGFIRVSSKRTVAKRYVIGADAASGLGDDDSAFICAIATPSGLEEVCSGKGKMPESEFADILYKKSQDYNNAFTVVEDAPVGKATLIKLNELHCNLYKRKVETRQSLSGDKLGFPTLSTTKPMMVADLADMVRDGTIIIHNLDILEQLMSYIRDEMGTYHATSGARDDYVSALMLLVQGMKSLPSQSKIEVSYPASWCG